MGHTVLTASNGLEALEIFKNHKFDFVFTDFKMPIMDGITFLSKLKTEFPERQPVLVAVTGGVSSEFSTEGSEKLDSLVEMLIEKPFTKRELEKAFELFKNKFSKVS